MAEFTLDEVYGKAPAGGPTPKLGAGEFSVDDVYAGEQSPKLSGGTKPNTAVKVGREVAGFLDMFADSATSVIPSAVNLLSNNIRDLGTPRTADVAKQRRTEYQGIKEHWSFHPFSKAMQFFVPPGVKDEETAVQTFLGGLMKASDSGLDDIEGRTNGLVRADDLKNLRDLVMDSAGAKGIGKSAVAVYESALKKAGKPKPPEAPSAMDPVEPPLEPFTPRGVRQPAGMPDIKTPAEQVKYNNQRRAEVRAAFKEDPDWGDYLKRTADYEAEQRAAVREESARLTPEQMAERTRPAERTAEDDAPRTLEQNRFGDLAVKEPTPLNTGLAKLARGRGFDLTAEERSAVNKSGSVWNRPGIILPAAIAATGLGLALNYAGDKKDDLAALAMASGAILVGRGKGLTLEDIAGHADTAPLRTFLDQSAYTLNTLEKLPPNRFQFSKESIEQLLKRPEVTQAERDVFTAALKTDDPAARDITAKDLMAGIKIATGDWELTKASTPKYADYGLEAIDRSTADPNEWQPELTRQERAETEAELAEAQRRVAAGPDATFPDWPHNARQAAQAVRENQERLGTVPLPEGGLPEPTTSIWRLPEHMEMSDANHFKDPRYFGHTRSFIENTIRHVVEIQSDLAQKMGKVLTEEAREETLSRRNVLSRFATASEEAHSVVNDARSTVNDYVTALDKLESTYAPDIWEDVKLRIGKGIYDAYDYTAETPTLAFFSKASAKGAFDEIFDFTKNAYKKAAETKNASQGELPQLGSALETALYREYRRFDVQMAEIDAKLNNSAIGSQVNPILKNWYKRLVREELADAAHSGESTVRFATADTVAMVEGWPDRDYTNLPADTPGGQFYPEHQGIYDRYKKDVEKFLNQLGGKPHTDLTGHTWIEVPVEGSKQLPAGKRTQMFGGADQKLMVGLATLGLGAVVGANLDKSNPIIGALLGMVGAAGLKRVGTEGVSKFAKAVAGNRPLRSATMVASGAVAGYVLADKKDKVGTAALGALAVAAARSLPKYTGLRIGAELNARDYLAQSYNLEANRLQFAILDKVKDPERLKAIWRANEPGGSMAGLSPVEREVAQTFRTYYAAMDKAAKEAGVYKEGLDNYMARLHDLDAKDVEFELEKLFQKTGKNGGNPFSKERKYLTLEDAKKAGYTPVTENPVEMLGIYANSMGKAIADKNLVKGLMNKEIPESKGSKFVMSEKDAPRTYVSLPGAAMRGKRAHPDLEGSLKFVFNARNPSTALRAVETFNAATKRIAVMASLFHAKSLLDAAVGAAKINKGWLLGGAAAGGLAGLSMDDPVLGAQIGAGLGMLAGAGRTGILAARGTLQYLEELKRGRQGGVIDRALKGGLEITMEKHPAAVEDQGGGSFYAGMQDASKLLDKTLKGSGKVLIDPIIKLNEVFDNLMWARLHTGLKLSIFDEKFNSLKENNARAAEKNPAKVKLLSEDELAHIAASFTNDTFGGLNWRRIAEGAQTRFGRALGEAVLSPTGRRAAQFVMFAPDWTLSTTRAFTGAFAEGAGLKGLMNPRTLADLHRQYILRSALYYALAGDGINYALSGHHLWDNKNNDWTRIELGDGRTMMFSKHMMEPYHWLTHPGQQALNKLSQPVKESLNQALGTEYLGGPKMKGNQLAHAAGSVAPIASQQSTKTGSAAAGIGGFLGFPIYGQTAEQKEEEKRRKRLEKLMQESQ